MHERRCGFSLLKDGDRLPALLPILDSLSERGALLGCGLIDQQEGRNRRKGEATVDEDITFFLFRTDVPWSTAGAFSRLPVE